MMTGRDLHCQKPDLYPYLMPGTRARTRKTKDWVQACAGLGLPTVRSHGGQAVGVACVS